MYYKIIRGIDTIGFDNYRNMTKEVNIVSWNYRQPKLDIRTWNDDHTRPSRGITLTDQEALNLLNCLNEYFGEKNK